MYRLMRSSFDPVKFYREFPAGGNSGRGDWLKRCLTAMCEQYVTHEAAKEPKPVAFCPLRIEGCNRQPICVWPCDKLREQA